MHRIGSLLSAAKRAHAVSRRCITTVRRSFMYVPADHESKLKKIPSMSPDCAVVDLEDGVGMQSKEQARRNVRRVLTGELPVHFGATEFALRINPVSGNRSLYDADVDAVFAAGIHNFPNLLVIPKVQDVEQIDFYFDDFARRIRLQQSMFDAIRERRQAKVYMELAFLIESPQAVISLRELLAHARSHQHANALHLSCIVFGADDYASAMQIERADDDTHYGELAYARQKLATCARAFDLDAIDLVLIDFRNDARLAESSRYAARVGFSGKQIVHPAQIRTVDEAFAPAKPRVDWATRLLASWNEHAARGTGVFVHEGKMIDMPTVLIARNVVARHNLICEREGLKRPRTANSS